MQIVAMAGLVSNRENIDAFRAKTRRSSGCMVGLQGAKAAATVGLDFAALKAE